MLMDLNYGFLIEKTGKKLKQELQKRFQENGKDITVDQWVILLELKKFHLLSQVELAEKTFKDAPTVTRIIDLLIKKELVIKTSSEDDRRKFMVSLSEKGKQEVEILLPIVQKFRIKGWFGLTENDGIALQRILNKIITNIQHGH